MNPFVGYSNIVYLVEAKDIASTITASSYMDLKHANRAAFLLAFGAITSATAGDVYDITVEAATAPDGTEAQIDFFYRKSGALGTNTWAAVTSASTLALAASVDDNKMVWIEINPDDLAANDYRYVRVKVTDNPDMTAGLVAVLGFVDQKFRQTTYASATASASA